MDLSGPDWIYHILGVLEFAFRPDSSCPEAIYRQLAEYLHGLIDALRLVPGERLPASRELAVQLGLSRNTVCHAYQRLLDDEVLTSHVGQGTFVAARPLRATSGGGAASRATDASGGESRAARGFAWEGLVADRLSRIVLPTGVATLPSPRFDFSGGVVDPRELPMVALRRAWSRALASSAEILARPISPLGLPALREEIALALVARGIECEAEDVLIVSGAQQALDLVSRALVDPGDTVVVEQPGYFGAALALRVAGARLVGVSVDEDGLSVDELARLLRVRRAKLVYVTPSAQSPTGAVLSEARREALLELSDQHQLPILEDDYDSELRFDGPVLPALKTRDRAGRVVYVGTFSKVLFPALRVGYVVAAPPLLARLAMLKLGIDFSVDGVTQVAVHELLVSGAFERHVRRFRKLHTRRRAGMLSALERFMPEGVRWIEPRGGHAVWVTLPAGVDGPALQHAAMRGGISYARGDAFSLDGSFANCFALSFVNQPEDAIAEGVEMLAGLIRAQREGSAA